VALSKLEMALSLLMLLHQRLLLQLLVVVL
jgi:hypothetical protein